MLGRRRQWNPTPVLLPGESHGWRSLVGCSPWGLWESDTTERLPFHFSLSCIGEGNGNPLQCSCLENPRDGGAWWAAVYGVAQSRTRLKQLSSSSSSARELGRNRNWLLMAKSFLWRLMKMFQNCLWWWWHNFVNLLLKSWAAQFKWVNCMMCELHIDKAVIWKKDLENKWMVIVFEMWSKNIEGGEKKAYWSVIVVERSEKEHGKKGESSLKKMVSSVWDTAGLRRRWSHSTEAQDQSLGWRE